MDFINSLFGMGTTSVVLLGAFFIAFIGYALGSIQVKGVSLGTAGVFLMSLLCGYLFTQPGLQNIPILSKFYIEGSASAAVTLSQTVYPVLSVAARSASKLPSIT